MPHDDDHERHEHKHRGKFSQGLVDTGKILDALDIQPGQTVIDAGCGNGYMAKLFAAATGQAGQVYALDMDQHFLGILKQETRDTNLRAMEADITTTTPLDESSADLVYVSTVVHGFSKDKLAGFVDEVKRLLKPGGRLAVVEIEKKETNFGPPMNLRYSPQELAQAIPLVPENTVRAGEHFYMQVFRNQ